MAELSRGFQSYVLRKIGEIDDFPIVYALHTSMDIEELDLFLRQIENDYNVVSQKHYSASGSKFVVTIVKRVK